MEDNNKKTNIAETLWATSWTHIRTVIDTAREPFLILDEDLRIVGVNSCFLRMFEVSDKNTEGKLIYDLGNGQWNIPKLKSLLEDILPKDTFFRDFEVDHDFPGLGRRILVLNARKIFFGKEEEDLGDTKLAPPLILLAMEDVTDRRLVSEKLAEYAQKIETQIGSKMQNLTDRVDELDTLHKIIAERDTMLEQLRAEIVELKKRLPN